MFCQVKTEFKARFEADCFLSAIAAMASPDKYCEAFKKTYLKLMNVLPVDDVLPHLYADGVINMSIKKDISDIPQRKKKAECLLDEIGRGLDLQLTEKFKKFIEVVDSYSEDEDDDVMKKVMEEIRSHLSVSQKAPANQPSEY